MLERRRKWHQRWLTICDSVNEEFVSSLNESLDSQDNMNLFLKISLKYAKNVTLFTENNQQILFTNFLK
jgi:hypothetical protein